MPTLRFQGFSKKRPSVTTLACGKSVVSRPREAYDARGRAQSEISALGETDGTCVVCSVVRKEIDGFATGN